MPIARFSLNVRTSHKMRTQLRKSDNVDLAAMWKATKITEGPGKRFILWAPEPALCERIAVLLDKEATFAKRNSCTKAELELDATRVRDFAKGLGAAEQVYDQASDQGMDQPHHGHDDAEA